MSLSIERVVVPDGGYYPSPDICKFPVQLLINDDQTTSTYTFEPSTTIFNPQIISKVITTTPAPNSKILYTIEVFQPINTDSITATIKSNATGNPFIQQQILYQCRHPTNIDFELLPYPVNIGLFINYLVLVPLLAKVKTPNYDQIRALVVENQVCYISRSGPIYRNSPVLHSYLSPIQNYNLNQVQGMKIGLISDPGSASSLPNLPVLPTLPDTSEILEMEVYPSGKTINAITSKQISISEIKAKGIISRRYFTPDTENYLTYVDNYFKVGHKDGITTYLSVVSHSLVQSIVRNWHIYKFSDTVTIDRQIDVSYNFKPISNISFDSKTTQLPTNEVAISVVIMNGINITSDVSSTVAYNYNKFNLPYPFGIYSRVSGNQYSQKYYLFWPSYLNFVNLRVESGGMIGGSSFTMYNSLVTNPDLDPPSLQSASITKISTFLNVLRIRAKDNKSGVSGFYINMIPLSYGLVSDMEFKAEDSLASGNFLDGYYEFIIDSRKLSDLRIDLSITDVVRNIPDFGMMAPAIYRSGFYYDSMNSIFPSPDFKLWTLVNVTSFKFYSTEMNVTDGDVENYVVFQLENPDLSFVPFITFYYGKAILKPNKYASFYGYWDETISSFVIPFHAEKSTLPDELSYELELGLSLDNVQLQSKFGSDARLTIISELGDIMPPMITDAVTLPPNQMGWIITIEDEHFGFLRGEFDIVSNIDPTPYKATIDLSNLSSGDKFKGNYTLAFAAIPSISDCIPQTFTIQKATLFDRSSPVPDIFKEVSPLVKIGNFPSYQLTCSSTSPDISPPEIISFNVLESNIDVGARPENRIVHFTLTTTDDSALSTRHDPVVFVSSINTEPLGTTSTFVNSVGNNRNYKGSINLPYGFGEGNALYFSVYGIFDKALNIKGYSTIDLQAISPNKFYINRSHSFGPNLKSHSYVSNRGGEIFIEGSSFKSLTGSGQSILTLDFKNGTTIQPTIKNLYSVVFSFDLQPTSQPFTIFLTVN
eukprot:gene9620-11790_t